MPPLSLCHPNSQRGFALMALLALLTAGVLYFLVHHLDAGETQRRQADGTAQALTEVKLALIGSVISSQVSSNGYFPLPDLGHGISIYEGTAGSSFSQNAMDRSVVGRVPWKTLGMPVPRDGQGECLWYAISGRFKNTPRSNTPLNWDTLGQLDVIDNSGNSIAVNVVALLVAPGVPLDGQDRALSHPTYIQCGGNYDARNYLDPYNATDAIAGEVNYFPNFAGSDNHRVAADASNKRFVMPNGDHYNDRFLVITVDDIFRPIIRRSDFKDKISELLLADPIFQVSVAGSKGTDHVNCLSAPDPLFCSNWKEMLLLKEIPATTSVTINGEPASPCTRVLLFGGQKTSTQVRVTPANKSNPANYLEDLNLTTFNANVANSVANFGGLAQFDANNPSADLARCVP